jgi:integrase
VKAHPLAAASIYSSAVLDRLVAPSPVVRVQLPRDDRDRVVPLTVEQVQTPADAVPARYRAMVIAQAGLGLRIGELLALRLGHVDFLRRTVRIEWQIAPNTQVRAAPKTPRSRRTVPLLQVVADALAARIAEFPPGADGSLFTSSVGVYLQDFYGSRVFTVAVKRAGLPAGTTTHDLRHHYASVLLVAGESVVAVAERLGHENATLMLKTYGHLMPGSEDRTRRAVDEAWCAMGVPSEQAVSR